METARKRVRAVWVALALVGYAGLLSYRLGEREFWLDEQITVGHLGDGQVRFDAFHPPGYYWLLAGWRDAFGDSEGALRAFSVVWALVAAVLVWLLGRELLPPPQQVLGLWLFVLSPFALLYFRMARYFSLTAAVALAAAYLAVRAKREGGWWYAGLGTAAVALLWVDYLPLVLLVGVYLWLLPTAWRRGGDRYWWLGAAAVPLLVAVAQLPTLVDNAGMISRMVAEAPDLGRVARRLALPFWAALIGETTDPWRFWLTVPVGIAGITLAAAGLGAMLRARDSFRGLQLWAWPAAVLLATAVLSTVAVAEPWTRVSSLSLFALPFFLFWIAAGAGKLRKVGWALLAVFLAGQVYGVGNYLARRQFLNPGYNVPWREVNALVQGEARGQRGLAVAYFDATPGRYWDGPVPFVEVTEPEVPPEVPEIRSFPAGGEVWVIDRERGSGLARSQTAALVKWLQARGARLRVYQVMPYTPEERYWRERLGGETVGEAYLRVWRAEAGDSPRPST